MRRTPIASKTFGDSIDEAQATIAMTDINNIWPQLFPDEQQRIVGMLVEKIIIDRDNINLHLREGGVQQLVLEFTAAQQVKQMHCA